MRKNRFGMLKKVGEHERIDFRKTDKKAHIEAIKVVDDIPVMIDDVKMMDHFNMTRASFFTIQSNSSSENWLLDIDETIIPFYLLGLSGIITQPIGNKTLFDSAELIDELFDLIEEHPNLSVDTDDLWLPNFLFSGPLKRGQVYRLNFKLFREAHLFKLDEIPDEYFVSICKELANYIRYSKNESIAFRTWEKIQIEDAIKQYPKNSELALEWFEKEEK